MATKRDETESPREIHVLVMIVNNWNSCILMVEIKNGTQFNRKQYGVSQKI